MTTPDDLVERVAMIICRKSGGCFVQPEKWHREYAEEILSEIRAALDEPNEAMIDAAEAFKASGGQGYTGILRAMLAASPLGGAE